MGFADRTKLKSKWAEKNIVLTEGMYEGEFHEDGEFSMDEATFG